VGFWKQKTLDAPFDAPTLLSKIIGTKKHVNATFDAQVVFIRDDEVQRILAYKLGHQI
jgi:hypothetical protein